MWVIAAGLFTGCAKVYYSNDAITTAGRHNTIAIVPPVVSIAARKKVDAEALKEQQKTESASFQKEMYSWLLKRKMQNKISKEIQDIETTNAKLRKAGYFDGTPLTPEEMGKLLGVDAVVTSNYSLTKPMSDGAAITAGLVAGFWGSTNQTTVTLGIHDIAANKIIWNYNHKMSGTIGSSPASLVDNLMRNATKKMPYNQGV